MSTPMRRTRSPCCARAASGQAAAPASATTNFRRAIGTVMDPAPSGLNPGQRDDTMFWGLHEPAHTTAVTAGRLLWVIKWHAQGEHITSASSDSGRSPAARNAALGLVEAISLSLGGNPLLILPRGIFVRSLFFGRSPILPLAVNAAAHQFA